MILQIISQINIEEKENVFTRIVMLETGPHYITKLVKLRSKRRKPKVLLLVGLLQP